MQPIRAGNWKSGTKSCRSTTPTARGWRGWRRGTSWRSCPTVTPPSSSDRSSTGRGTWSSPCPTAAWAATKATARWATIRKARPEELRPRLPRRHPDRRRQVESRRQPIWRPNSRSKSQKLKRNDKDKNSQNVKKKIMLKLLSLILL